MAEGQVLANVRPHRLYATQDGTITRVEVKPGLECNGVAVSLAPVSRYLVYCTIDGGYDADENDWVALGQEVYFRCSKDGTHTGKGRIISIDGAKYNVEMTAGEMYVGEAVKVYRTAEMAKTDHIGVGTVVSTTDEQYNVNGTVLTVNVTAGDEVERGQLLLTWADDSDLTVVSPVDGIVTELPHANGEKLTKDQTVVQVTAFTDIWLQLKLPEEDAARLQEGDPAVYTLLADPLETEHGATVLQICELTEGAEERTIYLLPDVPETLLGAGVTVSLKLR